MSFLIGLAFLFSRINDIATSSNYDETVIDTNGDGRIDDPTDSDKDGIADVVDTDNGKRNMNEQVNEVMLGIGGCYEIS